MAQRSRFWDGTTIGDATVAPYDAGTEFSEVMTAVAGLTVNPNKGGPVSAVSISVPFAGTVRLAPLEAIVYGAWYQNDANVDFVVATPAAATRIDVLVLRKSWAAQTVRAFVITGTEGGSQPALVQTPGVTWDVPIATITITTGGAISLVRLYERADLWYRVGMDRITTDNNIGVKASPLSAWPFNWPNIMIGRAGHISSQTDASNLNFGVNTYFDGTTNRAITSGESALSIGLSTGAMFVYTAPAVGAGGAQAFTARLLLNEAGTLTLSPSAANRGLIVGAVTGNIPYITVNNSSKSGGGANSAANNIEFGNVTGQPSGIDGHVFNAYKHGILYYQDGAIFIGRDIGWGVPTGYLNLTSLNFGFGRIRESAATPYIDGQNGGYLMLGAGHSGGNAISVAPANHNAIHFGWGDRGWALVHSVSGLVQDSAVEAKTNIVPLEPEAGIEAIRNTQPVRFAYKQPVTGPIKRDVTRPMDMKLLRDRLANYEKNKAFSTQHGFVLGSPDFPCDPLFETGKGQMNPANSVGVLIAALRYMDTYSKSLEARIAALEGA